MKNIFFVAGISVCAFMASSCAVINNLDEVLTLKEYSDERDGIQADVIATDVRVDKLLMRVRSKASFEAYDRRKFVEEFGMPLLVRQVFRDGQAQESWLYRYALNKKDIPKVYVFFKLDGTWAGLSAEGL